MAIVRVVFGFIYLFIRNRKLRRSKYTEKITNIFEIRLSLFNKTNSIYVN